MIIQNQYRGLPGVLPGFYRGLTELFLVTCFVHQKHYNFDMAKVNGPPPTPKNDLIDLPDDRTESEREHDRKLENVDNFFAGLQPGVRLLIERLQPSWCSGLLEEITIGEDCLDLEYFVQTWGEKLLACKIRGAGGKLRGSYKIPLNTYPPLIFGELLEKPNPMDHFKAKEGEAQRSQQGPMVIQPAAAPDNMPFLLEMLKQQQAQATQNLTLMMQMMKAPQGGGMGGIADIAQLGTVMGQLQEVFKNNNSDQGSSSSEMDFIPQALDVLKLAMDNRPEKQPQKPRLTGPSKKVSPPPAGAGKVTQLRSPQDHDIAGAITEMDPTTAAQTIIKAIGSMPSDKRNAAMGVIAQEYQATMGDEEQDFDEEEEEDQDQRGSR